MSRGVPKKVRMSLEKALDSALLEDILFLCASHGLLYFMQYSLEKI